MIRKITNLAHSRSFTSSALIAATLLIGGLAFVIFAGGCDSTEPTVESPIDGARVTAPTLIRQVERAATEAKAKAASDDRAERARLRAAQADATARAIEIASRQEIVGAQVKSELALLRASTDAVVADITDRAESRSAALTAYLNALDASTETAVAVLEAKQNQRNAIVRMVTDNPFVKSAAATVGIDTGGLGGMLASGATVAAIGAWRAKKQRADARAEGEAKANRASELRDATWDEAQKNMLLLTAQPPVVKVNL